MNPDSTNFGHYIPYQRHELVELCLKDKGLSAEDSQAFSQFAELFTAFTHFDFHQQLEDIKSNYWAFDPDKCTLDTRTFSQEEKDEAAQTVLERFQTLAELSNFQEISTEEIRDSFKDSTLFDLATDVELEDFYRMACFYRGQTRRSEKIQRAFRKVKTEYESYDQVLLLLHFKDEDYFIRKARRRDKKLPPDLGFNPGKIYVYFYKEVPKADLELIFPNVKMSMTLKDKLMLSVPAVGAGITALVKISTKIALLVAAIAIALQWDWLNRWVPSDEDVTVNNLAALTALFTVLVTLGLMTFKQIDNYKNKRTLFLKRVSENLFFRNLASNQSVFHRMLDSAEEEECKEAMLVYYHLLSNPEQNFSATALDQWIEDWMKKTFGVSFDFDIDGPLANLQRIRGPIRGGEERALLEISPEGHLIPLPLADAQHLLDFLWDNAYQYA